MDKDETREEFYTRCLKEHGYICPANKFDQPNFSKMKFAEIRLVSFLHNLPALWRQEKKHLREEEAGSGATGA